MRLLHVVATAQRRGAEMFAADLIAALGSDGIDQRAAVLRGSSRDVDFGAPVSVLRSGGWRVPGVRVDLGTVGALRDLVIDWRPDVMQVHGGEPLKHALLAARRSKTSVVYRRIGSAPRRMTRGLDRVAHGHMMRRATQIVTVAEALRRETVDAFGVPPERVTTIPNAVNVERLRPTRSREATRSLLGISGHAPVLISLGALTWEKDPLTHVAVSAAVLAERPDARHLFVGDGPLRPALESAVRERHLDGRVLILGSREDVPDLLGATDLMLLASRVEGLPACLIEAGVAGLPVAAFGLAGVPEIVDDGRTGLLVSTGDVEELARAASRLVADAELRASMGGAARQRCTSLFDIRDVAPRYLELYQNLVKQVVWSR
jgi:glycosyltransferase involved in cell wall biosynthesis